MEALWEIPPTVWIAGGLALYMAWAIGANDVANAMGTNGTTPERGDRGSRTGTRMFTVREPCV